jgi:hypothetical protein
MDSLRAANLVVLPAAGRTGRSGPHAATTLTPTSSQGRGPREDPAEGADACVPVLPVAIMYISMYT